MDDQTLQFILKMQDDASSVLSTHVDSVKDAASATGDYQKAIDQLNKISKDYAATAEDMGEKHHMLTMFLREGASAAEDSGLALVRHGRVLAATALAASGAAAAYYTLTGRSGELLQVAGTLGGKLEGVGQFIGNLNGKTIALGVAAVAAVAGLAAFREEESKVESSSDSLSKVMTLLGLGGAGAGLYGLYDKFKSVASDVAQIGDNAKKAQTDVDTFQKVLFSTGGSTGDVTSSLSGITDKLNEAMQQENSLTKILDANNVKWRDGDKLLLDGNQALMVAADLIKKAGSNADQAKIADKFGIAKSLIPQLEQGRQAIQANEDEFTKLGLSIDQSIVDKAKDFDQGWKASSLLATTYIKAWVAESIPVVDKLIKQAEDWAQKLKDALGLTQGGDVKSPTETLFTPEFNSVSNKMGKDLLSLFSVLKDGVNDSSGWGQLGTAMKTLWDDMMLTGKEGQFLDDRFNSAADALRNFFAAQKEASGVPVPKPRPTIVPDDDAKKGKLDQWDREVQQLQRRNAALLADAASVGFSTNKNAELRAELGLLQAAQQAGLGVTNKQIDQYAQLRATMSSHDAQVAAGIKLDAEHAKSFEEVTKRAGEATKALQEKTLADKLAFETSQLYRSDTDQKIASQLKSIYGNDYIKYMDSAAAQQMRINDAVSQFKSLIDGLGSDLSTALVTAAQKGQDAWTTLLTNMKQRIMQFVTDLAVKQFISYIWGAFGGLSLGGAPMNLGNPGGTAGNLLSIHAKGNVFGFASGAAFASSIGSLTNAILTRPTFFPMAGGAGVAGERGTEAVVPLTRDASGRLGVSSVGGGNIHFAPTTHITINQDGSSSVKTSQAQAYRVGEAMNNRLQRLTIDVIQREMRPGGQLWNPRA